MKVKVEVDLNDFYEDFDGEKVEQMLAETLKQEIMKIVKRDQRYKAFVAKKATDVLDGLDV